MCMYGSLPHPSIRALSNLPHRLSYWGVVCLTCVRLTKGPPQSSLSHDTGTALKTKAQHAHRRLYRPQILPDDSNIELIKDYRKHLVCESCEYGKTTRGGMSESSVCL